MSEAERARLRRAWLQDGTVEAERRYLTARQRACDLGPAPLVLSLLRPEGVESPRWVEAHDALVEDDPLLQRGRGIPPATAIARVYGHTPGLLRDAQARLARRLAREVSADPLHPVSRERLVGTQRTHYRLKRQTSCPGEFADITLEVAAEPDDRNFSFVNQSDLPGEFVAAVRDAALGTDHLREGWHCTRRVTLLSGRYHEVDSSPRSFHKATRWALRDAFANMTRVPEEPWARVLEPAAREVRWSEALRSKAKAEPAGYRPVDSTT